LRTVQDGCPRYRQLQNGQKKAQKSTKTAANVLDCLRFEFSRIFVFFAAIYHQFQIAIL